MFEEDRRKAATPRKLSIYPTQAGFDLLNELEYLTWRSIEPNIFFNPRFLIPAMPRLDDRQVRLLVMRDEDEERSRPRFLMPYTIERPGFSHVRADHAGVGHTFAPQGTPAHRPRRSHRRHRGSLRHSRTAAPQTAGSHGAARRCASMAPPRK